MLFRIFKVQNLSKKLEELLNLEGMSGTILLFYQSIYFSLEGFYNFTKLFFIIIYIAHICACI